MSDIEYRRTRYIEGWTLYPAEAFGHHVQGAIVAGLIFIGSTTACMVAAILWTFLYVSYQGLSVIRKKDSAGLDVMDFMVGFGFKATLILVNQKFIGISMMF